MKVWLVNFSNQLNFSQISSPTNNYFIKHIWSESIGNFALLTEAPISSIVCCPYQQHRVLGSINALHMTRQWCRGPGQPLAAAWATMLVQVHKVLCGIFWAIPKFPNLIFYVISHEEKSSSSRACYTKNVMKSSLLQCFYTSL